MNRDIIELREVVQKLVPLLAGKGLVVTQRGSQAYVSTNPKTRKPERVNIPNISDNATQEFIEAIQGFIDHEVGHVLHTDWDYYGRAPSAAELRKTSVQQFLNTHNIVEDVMIEREMGKTFPGSKKNISRTRKYFLAKITDPAVKAAADEREAFIYLCVPTMRALGGHEEMQEYMDAGGYWSNKYVKEVVDKLKPETIELLKTCSHTKETLAIAEELHLILYPPPPPAPMPMTPPPTHVPDEDEEEDTPPPSKSSSSTPSKPKDPEPEEDEDDEPTTAGSDPSAGDGEENEDEDVPGAPSTIEPEADADGDDDEEIPDTAGEDDGDDTDADDGGADGAGDDDDEPAGAGEEDEDIPDDDGGFESTASSGIVSHGLDDDREDEDDDAAGSGGDGADESGDDDDGEEGPTGKSGFRTEGAEGGGVGSVDTERNENPGGGGGGVGNEAGKPIFDFEEDAFDKADMSSQIGILISDEAVMAMDPGQYLVFSREMDRIEPIEPPERMNEQWVPEMENRVRQMTAKMRKDIERIMASDSYVIRTPGHKRGKLHSPSLFRVLQGDPRVFSVREEHKSKDTAVMLLADNSGSMHGEKCELAMIASYALAATLEAVKIPYEVLGFTSGDFYDLPISMREAIEKDIAASEIQYDRVEPIMIPIYKSFAERLDATVKKRFAYVMNAQNGLQGNIDGESLEYAAERLLKRQEKRKVMMVLSDGQPAGSHKSGPHLSYVTRQLEKMGIECIGIGILDSSVKKYYPKWTVLKDVNDLPNQVMKEIQAILR
jgi:cobalamin biosynthesis protein CobT